MSRTSEHDQGQEITKVALTICISERHGHSSVLVMPFLCPGPAPKLVWTIRAGVFSDLRDATVNNFFHYRGEYRHFWSVMILFHNRRSKNFILDFNWLLHNAQNSPTWQANCRTSTVTLNGQHFYFHSFAFLLPPPFFLKQPLLGNGQGFSISAR